MTVGFQRQLVLLHYFTRFQRQSVLLCYEISMMVSFVQLRDFNYGFQRQTVLFCYEISKTVGFVLL